MNRCGPAAAACVAVFAHTQGARRSEQLLGRLCAEGALEVLDGALLVWSGPIDRLGWRPLENLPRLAALPEAVWTAIADELTLAQPGRRRRVLPDALAGIVRGGDAVVAFCATPSVERLTHEFHGLGAAVTTVTLTANRYAELRGGHPRRR
jgi:hypothetical protein